MDPLSVVEIPLPSSEVEVQIQTLDPPVNKDETPATQVGASAAPRKYSNLFADYQSNFEATSDFGTISHNSKLTQKFSEQENKERKDETKASDKMEKAMIKY